MKSKLRKVSKNNKIQLRWLERWFKHQNFEVSIWLLSNYIPGWFHRACESSSPLVTQVTISNGWVFTVWETGAVYVLFWVDSLREIWKHNLQNKILTRVDGRTGTKSTLWSLNYQVLNVWSSSRAALSSVSIWRIIIYVWNCRDYDLSCQEENKTKKKKKEVQIFKSPVV